MNLKLIALLGLGYLAYQRYKQYQREKLQQDYIKLAEERQRYVDELMDKFHKAGKRSRYIEVMRHMQDYQAETGKNPYRLWEWD